MNRTLLSVSLVLIASCSSKEPEPMGEMSAAEHARMLAGGSQGSLDSTGAVRNPVHLTAEQERRLGVTYLTVSRDTLRRTLRTVGTIQAPEQNIADVVSKVEGFVERLDVATTGAAVTRGAPLLAVYSPTLIAAQEELLTARRLVARLGAEAGEAGTAARQTLEAARRRLSYWDISTEQVAALESRGSVTRTLTLVAPVSGIVLEKSVVEGQRVMPGDRLYRIADLSEVWVEGEVFEQDLPLLRDRMQVHIEIAARPGEHLMGRLSFVYPTVDPVSRTNKVRLTVPNPDGQLKPGMFATIFIDALAGRDVVAVPRSAVVVTGARNIVFVRDADGMLHPRDVVLGIRASDRVEILSGLSAGETIAASANFLIDAESRLGGASSTMPGMQHGPAAPAPARAPETRHDH